MNNYKNKRGPEFVDIDSIIEDNLTPEQEQLFDYEYLVRSVKNDYSSPLDDSQKLICNLLMAMKQVCADYVAKELIDENGYKTFDQNLMNEYCKKFNQKFEENLCVAEEKIRKGNAWFDIEGMESWLQKRNRVSAKKLS